MEEKLKSTRLLVSFNNLNIDESSTNRNRNEQTILELALQYEIIPVSKTEQKTLSFHSNDDCISVAFLNDLIARGYSEQAILEVALLCNVTPVHVTSTTYCFEPCFDEISLYNFLSDLFLSGFSMTYQIFC